MRLPLFDDDDDDPGEAVCMHGRDIIGPSHECDELTERLCADVDNAHS